MLPNLVKIKILSNPWFVGIGTGLIVLLSGYYVFGIGKSEASIKAISSPCSINTSGQSGGSNSVNCDSKPLPKIGTDITTPSKLQNNGLYHTSFHVTIGFAIDVEATGTLNINPLLDCQTSLFPKSGKGGIRPAGDITGIFGTMINYSSECISRSAITSTMGLFTWSPQ